MKNQIKSLLFLLSGITGLVGFSTQAQNLTADLLKNSGSLSAHINQYDPDRFDFLIGCKSVDLAAGNEKLEFEGTRWQISTQIKPLEKAGKYEVTVFFNCLSGEVRDASISVDFNLKTGQKKIMF
jgi:phosphopantothenate synthetase